ncbi:Myelin gene regulatory factor C-terminal domain 2 [Trinorchestia longiramus]|nr:Myelin gene regulatory factor C-terminal domain 2 [Trinorchestia longiramus]
MERRLEAVRDRMRLYSQRIRNEKRYEILERERQLQQVRRAAMNDVQREEYLQWDSRRNYREQQRNYHSKEGKIWMSNSGYCTVSADICSPVITIVEFDAIITHLYCLNTSQEIFHDCMASSSGNKTYGIPVSKFMNNVNLTLTFTFAFPECEATPSYCYSGNSTQYSPQLCPSASMSLPPNGPSVIRRSPREMILADVGLWESVAYPFRLPVVGTMGSDMNLCTQPASDVGVSYVEYNIFFYRVCDE